MKARTKIALRVFALLLCVALPGLATPAAAQDADADAVLENFDLKGAQVVDAARLLGEATGLNIVTTNDAGEQRVTLYLRNTTGRVTLDTMCKAAGLWYREDPDSGVFRVMTTAEYQSDLVVFREDETRVFTLRHPNSVSVAAAIRDLYGDRVELTFGTDQRDIEGDLGFGTGSNVLNGSAGSRRNNRTFDDSTRSDADFDRGGGFSGSGRSGDPRSRPEEVLRDRTLTGDQIRAIERTRATSGTDSQGEDVQRILREIAQREQTIYVTINRRNNLVLVRTGDRRALDEIADLIEQMDRPVSQVLLEVKILELELSDGFRSVFDVEYTGGDTETGPATSQPRNPLLGGVASAPRNVAGLGNFPLEGGTLVYQFMNDHLRARLQLQETEGRLTVLGTPVILCANDEPATLFIGEERPLVRNFTLQSNATEGVVTDRVVPTVELQDVGNTLQLRPRINADRTVTLTILQDSSTINADAARIPVPLTDGGVQELAVDTVNSLNVQATVIGKDGLMVAVGGLIRVTEQETQEKVPLAGDIPLLGALFRREVRERRRTELIVLITPHILTTPLEARDKSKEALDRLSEYPHVNEVGEPLPPPKPGSEK